LRILVTGPNGFIGSALVPRLLSAKRFQVRAAVRNPSVKLPSGCERDLVREIGPDTDWTHAVSGVDVVVHLAGRAHVMRATNQDALDAFRRVNVSGTLNLAAQSARAGVKRFVFLSSAKVFGDSGHYSERDTPVPTDSYGVSKYDAEQGLQRVAAQANMEYVIIRPPLVYGPGAKANFEMLIKAIEAGIPLPLAAIGNRRSFVALDNLVDFIVTCISHPAAANEIFLVSDGEDLSTPDLIRRLAAAMSKRPRLLPVPVPVLKTAAAWIGRRGMAQRLTESLYFDTSKTSRLLGWSAPLSVDEGLRRAVAPN